MDKFIGQITSTFDEFRQSLVDIEKAQPGVVDADTIRERFDQLFDGRVGLPPQNQEDLDKIYESGKKRFADRTPPGYMDDDKKDTYSYGGLVFRAKFGDLLVWEQIIEQSKNLKYKYVVFVTDDDKEDWWWIIESKGRKTIGPRPELIEEICRRTDVSDFYMYSSERFLLHAKEYLGTEIKPESVEQVRDVSKLNQRRQIRELGRQAVLVVGNWLRTRYPNDRLLVNDGFPDLIVSRGDGTNLGFEVQYIWDEHELEIRTSSNFYQKLIQRPTARSLDNTFIFIAGNSQIAELLLSKLPASQVPFPYVVGMLRNDSHGFAFVPIYESKTSLISK